MTTPKAPSLSLSLPPSMQQALPTAKPLYDIASIAQAAAGLTPVTAPKAKAATPAMLSVTPTKGGNLVRLDSSGLSSIAQEAASMVATMPITKPGAKPGSSVSVVPFTGSGVSTPTTPAAAAATAAASVDDGSIPGLTNSGGGGDSPAPYQDPGPSQGAPDAPAPDDGGGYYDPTWDNNTTAVPASTAVLVASTATPSKVSAATTAAAPTAAATASKPIWTRIWQFLFGGKSVAALPAAPASPAAVVHGEPGSLEAECGSIIRRARLGDQNATALLVSTRENAARGSAKAKKSLAIMLKYIDSHPVDDSGAEIGGELDHAITYSGTEQVQHHAGVCDPVLGTAVSLSRGESLSNPRIERYLSQFGGEMQRAMIHGMLNPRRIPKGHIEPNLAKAHAVGRAIGAARRLQAVRAHGSTMTALDPVIGWECGE